MTGYKSSSDGRQKGLANQAEQIQAFELRRPHKTLIVIPRGDHSQSIISRRKSRQEQK